MKFKIIDQLKEHGFTGDFQLFYHPKDGWYLHCDQCQHRWIGQNSKHVLECIQKGELDYLTKTDI